MKYFGSLFCTALFALLAFGCQSAPKPKAATGTLLGVVFDLDKSPVSGALIEIEGPGGKASALTDSQGRFSVPSLASGDCTLTFSKSMYEKSSWTFTFADFNDVVYLQAASYWQLLDAALAAIGRKELGEAEDYLVRARGIQEKSSTSLFLDGVLAEKRGDFEPAIVSLEEAVALDPRSPYLWLCLADLYQSSNASAEKIIAALDTYLDLRYDPVAAERRKGLCSLIP